MPYNNTPIAPPAENSYTGETKLPLARVKKIISADDDIGACSANAAFAITIATEMFIQHLVNQTHAVARTDNKKARRNIAYRDVAAAVAKFDDLEFLSDVVPRTVTYRAYQARRAGTDAAASRANGDTHQRTLDQLGQGHPQQQMQQPQHTQQDMEVDGEERPTTAGRPVESPRSARSAGTRFDVVTGEEIRPARDGAMDED